MSTARFDLGLISTRSPEGILCQASATDQKAETSQNAHLKIAFSYLISVSIWLPSSSTALEMFIVARNDAIKIQADDCTRYLPGQTLRNALCYRDIRAER